MRRLPPLLVLFTCAACAPIVVERRGPPPAPLPPPVVYEPPPAGYGPPPAGRHDDDRRPMRAPDERGDQRQIDFVIDRAYRDLLERAPDPAGRDHYRQLLRQGLSEEQMRDRIRESVEYRVTLPDRKTTQAYQKVLGRKPDPSGLESYRKKIVDHGWSERDVENDLRRSAEYQARQRAGDKPDAGPTRATSPRR